MNQGSSLGGTNGGSAPPKKRSCCKTTLILGVLLCLVVAGGILIWQLLPEEQKAQLQGILNQTTGTDGDTDEGGGGSSGGGSEDAPTAPAKFEFNRCAADATSCCNGVETLCDVPASDVMFGMVHNAMSTFEDGFFLGNNHDFALEGALEAGYRAINVDIWECGGDLKLAHASCALGTRDPVEVFTNIASFLDANPNEVLLLTMQVEVDDVDFFAIYSLMQAAPGFSDQLYVHDPDAASWPTLQELIDADTRIMFFHFNGPSCSTTTPCPAGFHDWFAYAVEAQFSFNRIAQVQNATYACELGRGRNARRDFYGLNSFLSIPSEQAAGTLNSKEFLEGYIDDCIDLSGGLDVNVMSVDFWSDGDLVEVVQLRNEALGQARRNRRLKSLR